MGCILTPADITALRDLVPHVFSISVGGEQSVDYRELARLLETYTPKFTTGFGGSFVRTAATTLMRTPSSYNRSESNATLDFHGMSSRPTTPFSPFNGSPFSTTRLQPQTNTTLSAPGGQFISTSNLNRSVDFGGTSKGVAAFEMVLCAIAERVSTAAQNRSAVRGVPYSILKQLAAFDRNGSGFVTVRVLQSTLRDLGVALSPTDLLALNSAFGAADGGIDYSAFSQMCDREGSSAGESAFSSTKKSHNLFGEMPKTSLSFLQKPRIMQRLLELQREGDLRSVFSASDIDGSGLVSAMKFAQIVRDLALLQSEYQVGQCVSAFASLSDRQCSMVCYEDFCDELDRMAADFAASHEGLIPPPHTNRTLRESLATITDFNSAIGRVSQKNSEPADIEEDDDGDEDDQEFGPPRSPSPKPRQERRYDRRYSSSPSCHSRSIPDNSAASFSPARRSNIGRIEAPRSPPRKVGASLWGSRTALHKKGIPHRQDDGETWVCAVCYYTENDAAARTCEVCTSPNHMNKDFQVKVQCSNCTFLNGQFALSCEMCGEGILKKRK